MAQYSYDVVPHGDGFAIMIAPDRQREFPTRQAAFDAAAELARKLRFVGVSLSIQSEPMLDRKTAGAR